MDSIWSMTAKNELRRLEQVGAEAASSTRHSAPRPTPLTTAGEWRSAARSAWHATSAVSFGALANVAGRTGAALVR